MCLIERKKIKRMLPRISTSKKFLIHYIDIFGLRSYLLLDSNNIFCGWIIRILHLTRLSVFVNGKSRGYFKCVRGVRKADTLSPILFFIDEEILNRSISLILQNGRLTPCLIDIMLSLSMHFMLTTL